MVHRYMYTVQWHISATTTTRTTTPGTTPATRPCNGNGKDTSWRTSGNDQCCTNGGADFCAEGEGDCDADSECDSDLVCGNDNCSWGDGDDCCEKLPTTTTTTIAATTAAGKRNAKRAFTLSLRSCNGLNDIDGLVSCLLCTVCHQFRVHICCNIGLLPP